MQIHINLFIKHIFTPKASNTIQYKYHTNKIMVQWKRQQQ